MKPGTNKEWFEGTLGVFGRRHRKLKTPQM